MTNILTTQLVAAITGFTPELKQALSRYERIPDNVLSVLGGLLIGITALTFVLWVWPPAKKTIENCVRRWRNRNLPSFTGRSIVHPRVTPQAAAALRQPSSRLVIVPHEPHRPWFGTAVRIAP